MNTFLPDGGIFRRMPEDESILQPSINFEWARGGQINPYIGSLLNDCNLASKELVYGLFRPSPLSAVWAFSYTTLNFRRLQ
jgi:hypothetical protein